MPAEDIKIILGDGDQCAAQLVYLANHHQAGPMYYLQAVRSYGESLAAKREALRAPYENMEKIWTGHLASQLPGPGDVIMSPPSGHPFAATYRSAVATRFSQSLDISTRFRRAGDVKAGGPETKAEDIYAALSYDRQGDETGWNAIIIVDDVFATGKTVTAVIQHLRDAGLRADAKITIGCPLRITQP